MAQNALPNSSDAAAVDNDDMFEDDLKDILKDGPNMNEISGSVHDGNMPMKGTEPYVASYPSFPPGRLVALTSVCYRLIHDHISISYYIAIMYLYNVYIHFFLFSIAYFSI